MKRSDIVGFVCRTERVTSNAIDKAWAHLLLLLAGGFPVAATTHGNPTTGLEIIGGHAN